MKLLMAETYHEDSEEDDYNFNENILYCYILYAIN
jgi:hypothetical protein